MPEYETPATVSSELSAVVYRCTCGNPEGHLGVRCPKAKRVDLGVLSYRSSNPIKQVLERIRHGVYKRNLLEKLHGRQKSERG